MDYKWGRLEIHGWHFKSIRDYFSFSIYLNNFAGFSVTFMGYGVFCRVKLGK